MTRPHIHFREQTFSASADGVFAQLRKAPQNALIPSRTGFATGGRHSRLGMVLVRGPRCAVDELLDRYGS